MGEVKQGRKPSSPLHAIHVQQGRALFNNAHTLFHTIAILALLYYRLSHLYQNDVPSLPWTLLFFAELMFSFLWFLNRGFQYRPVTRTAYPERIPKEVEFPGVDVFICTADPTKEPILEVMNTVLSAMSLDYPRDKLTVYLSDDGGSSNTLYAIKEASSFAKEWIPFCRKYGVKRRCPEAYFSSLGDDDRLLRNEEFIEEEKGIKSKYEEFKVKVDADSNISANGNRPPLVEVICEDSEVPGLVYVSRERRPIYPHRFKAGALNALLRVSGIISNSPYILVLDCDMYCNDPTSAKQAMCFHLDPEIAGSLAFVQFPQVFHNVSKNDIYDGQARNAYRVLWQGMDGLRGPVLSGTGFYMKRHALYGSPKQDDSFLSQPKRAFGPSNKFVQSVRNDHYEPSTIKNERSSHSLLQEAQFLATCSYEKDTEWGVEVGFSYFCFLESTFTGYLLHCKGWKSVYCFPSMPGFLGCTPTNMKDAMGQLTKWCSGLFGIAISRFCPLTYGMSRMCALQSMCYAYFAFNGLFSFPYVLYGVVPQLYLCQGIPLFPKASDPWFLAFLVVHVSSNLKHFVEVVSTGGGFKIWCNEQRMMMLTSVTAFLFGTLEAILKWFGISRATFRLTNKVVDQEQQKKYDKGVFDFEGATTFLIPLIILVFFNIGCFIAGARRVFLDKSYDQMFGQVYICFFAVSLSYPIIEGIITRRSNEMG